MVNDIDCHERSDELVCEINGDRVFVNELTKDQCQRTGQGEWVPGYDRVQNWSGVTDSRKRRALKRALRNDTNIVKSMSQQDDPPIKPSTAEKIQESYQPSVAGACRYGRDRAATQPNSYDTETESSTVESQPEPEMTVEEARESFEFEQSSLEEFGL